MPIATPQQFTEMLDAAQEGNYAYPAVNCTSITTMNATLKALADNNSDGFIQFSTGAGQFASGLNVKDTVHGVITLAEAAHRLVEKYDVLVALHTDHCQPEMAPTFLKPLIDETARRRAKGENNLFNGHMLDASILPLEENLPFPKSIWLTVRSRKLYLKSKLVSWVEKRTDLLALRICQTTNSIPPLRIC